MFRRNWSVLLLFAAATVLTGCGGSDDKWTKDRPKPLSVSGKVTLKGEPVAGATVVFQPDGHSQAATGQTDSTGAYKLQTYSPNDGAVPGKYKVTITKVEVTSTDTSQESRAENSGVTEQKYLIPQKYGNSMASGLTAEVTEGGKNSFDFDLTE
jgi:hypothetical protein